MSDEEDEDFSSLPNPLYECGWCDCDYKTDSVIEHQTHVNNHASQVIEETTSTDGPFTCSWQNCDLAACDSAGEFKLHVSFHAFHHKLMSWGLLYIESLSLREGRHITCTLDSSTKNHLPSLPEYLPCLWRGCSVPPFDDINLFFSHMEIHMTQDTVKDDTSMYQCQWDKCDASMPHRSHFKRHVRSHTQEKSVSCPVCGSMFSNSLRLIDHLMRQLTENVPNTQSVPLPNLICSECSLQLASKRLLDEHMRKHIHAIKCPECDYVADGKGALSRHIIYRHKKERNFACHHCTSSFKTASDLKKHLAFHDEVAYKCIVCNFEARSISVLNTHKKNVHGLGGDVYKCQLCEVKFQRAGSLTRHLSKQHVINLPKGRSRFKFKKYADGFMRAVIDWM